MNMRTAPAAARSWSSSTRREPVGKCRWAVRGFRASMKRSTTRLVAIAQVRAPTMAAVAQPTVHPPGQPPAARTIAVGEGEGEHCVLELDRVEHARDPVQRP